MNEVLKKIGEIGIIPVVVLDDAKDAEPLAKALIEGGLPVFRRCTRKVPEF
jgi:2-dehydro-3-deoxyphosphogluconate aldolase/(4S)-4-hydroxy-2-oxoglutarate aldolase